MTMSNTKDEAEATIEPRKVASRSRRPNLSVIIGSCIVGTLIVAAVIGPLVVGRDPNAVSLGDTLAPPGPDFLLGADQSGRDILARLLYGGRSSLVGPLLAVLLATALGVTLGMVAAWRGGWVDSLLQKCFEAVFAFPSILLAILMVTMLGRGLLAPVLAMTIAFTPFVAQVVRSVSLQEKKKPYIDAYRTLGFSDLQICMSHLLPNIASVVLAQSAIYFGYAVMVLGSISYLGFGIQPPDADWGRMIAEGQDALLSGAVMPSLAPGVCMVLAVIGFSLLGEGFADSLARRGGPN